MIEAQSTPLFVHTGGAVAKAELSVDKMRDTGYGPGGGPGLDPWLGKRWMFERARLVTASAGGGGGWDLHLYQC
jgi:hypothetical protein